jgi:hypothetical protein
VAGEIESRARKPDKRILPTFSDKGRRGGFYIPHGGKKSQKHRKNYLPLKSVFLRIMYKING